MCQECKRFAIAKGQDTLVYLPALDHCWPVSIVCYRSQCDAGEQSLPVVLLWSGKGAVTEGRGESRKICERRAIVLLVLWKAGIGCSLVKLTRKTECNL